MEKENVNTHTVNTNNENAAPKHKTTFVVGLVILIIIVLSGILLLGHTQTSKTNPMISASPTPTKPAGQTRITFSPNPLVLTQNTTGKQTIDILVDTQGNKIYGADVELVYDPSVLQDVTVNQGTFLQNATLLKNNPVDTVKGRISYMIAVSPKQGPEEGTGTLMSISFVPNLTKLQQNKVTGISFLPGTAVSASGNKSSALQVAVSEKIRYQQ